MHYEHQARDPEQARQIVRQALDELRRANQMGEITPGAYREIKARFDHRLARLERKSQPPLLDVLAMQAQAQSMLNQMDEGRKRVLGIIAGILVARHLKTTEDLHDRPSPRTESLVASAVQWAERIMRRIDGTFANSGDDKR